MKILLVLILALLFTAENLSAQTVLINDDIRTITFTNADDDKIIKTSAGLIKSKTNLTWVTNIHSKINTWNVVYSTKKEYTLKLNNKVVYTAMDIAGIRAKYTAILLGTETVSTLPN